MWRTEADAFCSGAVQATVTRARSGPLAPHGVWIPLVTPLRGGRVDLPRVGDLAARYAAAGVDGLIVLGTTGEGSLLAAAERQAVVAAAMEAVGGLLPVMAGAGGVDTREVAGQIAMLEAFDLAGYLVPPPYYLRPGESGIRWHYAEIRQSTAKPLMLYNVPRRTGCSMPLALSSSLLCLDGVVALKECDTGNLRTAMRNPHPAVLCGEDSAMLEYLLAGGAGIVSVAAHIRPDLFIRLVQLVQAGRIVAAQALFHELSPLIALLFAEPSPAPVKAALSLCGLIAPDTRLPLQPASRALAAQLAEAMDLLPPVGLGGRADLDEGVAASRPLIPR